MNKIPAAILLACISFFTRAQSTQLNIRAYTEGYYRVSINKMVAVIDPVNQPLVCDSATVDIIDVNNNTTVMCINTIVSTAGIATVDVPQTMTGHSYFVSVKFRNSFHILSAIPVLLTGNPQNVDLTIPQNACCNFDTAHGIAKAYSGDLNSDGAIDVADLSIWESEMQSHPNGYNISDVNGDNLIDTVDLSIIDGNSSQGRVDDRMVNCAMLTSTTELDENIFSVFPNPARSGSSILYSVSTESSYKITIVDITGREIKSVMLENGHTIFDDATLTAGIYLVKFISDYGNFAIRRLIIE